MGGKEISQADSQYFEHFTFHLNLLICGDYPEDNLEKEIDNIQKIAKHKGFPYIKKGNHKNIKDWNFYFFQKDKDIGENTYKFIEESITNEYKKDSNNVILFYSGLKDFTGENLIKYYDGKKKIYHPNFVIVTNKDESFLLPELKKINKERIRNVQDNNEIEIYVNLLEISSFVNQLGEEIGFPKNLMKEDLLDKDSELMTKYFFTFNILVCGRPGAGKSTLINRLLKKEKCYSGQGSSSLTQRIVKYISEKYPIQLYDTPGFENEKDIERVKKLIKDKNDELTEDRNSIHCVFYVMNAKAERTFLEKEYEFLAYLLKLKMDIYIIATHAQTKENSEDYIEAAKIDLERNSGKDKRIKYIKKYIYPVELNDEEHYKKFGLKEIFTSIYERYKVQKCYDEISSRNINEIKSIFLGELNSKSNVIKKLTALSRRAKANFKILASSLENSPFVKITVISNVVIRVISKIYNHSITKEQVRKFIKDSGYTDEFKHSDSGIRFIEKTLACLFYKNGPAAKQIDYLSEKLIENYNKELDNDDKFYEYLNTYRKAINYAIDCLNEISD